ncbi:sugar ABC transporter ATP-binding protein [Sphaerisporangium sp. NPDC051017]|uniref:sugar ABC transporter ATP-binding protein n=1 Tax=Sphaerisporangium sp. NPDC051017 TaxID=3154636 RepID=UPI003432E10D
MAAARHAGDVQFAEPAVSVRNLSKRFGSTQALSAVTLSIARGEVHGLVGENGAGKSTLGKVIGGLYHPDDGELEVFGGRVRRWDVRRAQDAGVVIIAQELSLVPALTVAQNVFLGRERRTLGVLHPGLERRYQELERVCGFGLPPDVPVDSLPIADQQKVEIMRALARDAKVIVMDEPTSSLTADEAARLHDIIARLRSRGTTIVYVTHFLEDVLEHCDRVTVMRDGQVIRTADTASETKASLVEAMLGEPADVLLPERPPAPGPDTEPLAEMRDVHSGDRVRGVSLTVRPGEIVGLAGLVGSGRTEIARVLFGCEPADSGRIVFRGAEVRGASARGSIERGMAMIPEDRRAQGLVLARPALENVTLPHLRRFSKAGVLARRAERSAVEELIEQLGVRPRQVDGDVSVYSGGNQQKVLFAKWLLGRPELLILDEPTRGVDVGAKARIYQLIVGIARSGTGVLLISSELQEVVGLSHRVYLVRQGSLIGEMASADTSVDVVLQRLFGVGDTPTTSTPSGNGEDV